MALTFQLKNRLLQGLNDDHVAFNIAAEWVDTEEKLTIFERQLGKADAYSFINLVNARTFAIR